jgi:hypothetical protein
MKNPKIKIENSTGKGKPGCEKKYQREGWNFENVDKEFGSELSWIERTYSGGDPSSKTRNYSPESSFPSSLTARDGAKSVH